MKDLTHRVTQTLRGIYPSLVQILGLCLALSIHQKCEVRFKEDAHKNFFLNPHNRTNLSQEL
jgi:hypothetical protein